MQVGDKVTVDTSVVVFNHPEHRGEAFDMQGQSGDVVNVLNDWKGRVISPTLPVIDELCASLRQMFYLQALQPIVP